jgi:two-component system response regulator YesN
LRILVIDDESRTRAGIIRLINKLNSDFIIVGEADNGYDGMMMIRKMSPDVVITDIMMPRLNGLEMIADAKSCSPGTKFLILSGYAEFELAQQAIKLAVADYLLKPVTKEQLHNALLLLQKKTSPDPANPEKKPIEISSGYGSITSWLVKEIENNFAAYLYLDDLARKIGITPEYAGNVFSRETGKSFNLYLRDTRMEQARKLLETSGDRIYEIAYKTGYSDVKYFCRVFKEYTGISATSYRLSKKIQAVENILRT